MPVSTPRGDIAALLEHASPTVAGQLLDRAPDVVEPFLRSALHIPGPLLDAVLASPGPLIQALLKNTRAMSADARLRARICASGHAAVALRARTYDDFRLPELRVLMASADPGDTRWTERGGPVESLLRACVYAELQARTVLQLRAAVASPFPQLVAHVLGGVLPRPCLTRAELLRAQLSLYTYGGPAALEEALGRPERRETLGDTVGYGEAAVRGAAGALALRAAVEEAEGTAGAIEELYESGALSLRPTLSLRATLDWPAVLEAHRRRPFPLIAIRALTARDDCTDETVEALCAAHPHVEELVPELDRAVPLRVLEGLPSGKRTRKVLAPVVERGLGRTVAGPELLDVRPGTAVLEMARDASRGGAPHRAAWAAFRAELGALLGDTLKGDVAAWRVVRERMARYRGTVAELLRDAADRAARGEGAGEGWPQSADAPSFLESASLRGTRASFLTLLESAEPEIQWALLDQLDDRTRYDLLVLGTWHPRWLDHAREPGRRRERVLLSRRRDLPADAVTALAALDDPAVNAGLVYQRSAPWEQRHALLTGIPLGGGGTGRAARLPVDEEVRGELLTAGSGNPRLHPWAGSGDAELVEHCLRYTRLGSRNTQLRFLLGIWERQGHAAVLDQVPGWFGDSVRALLKELLADADQGAALHRLREAVREAESTKQLARRLRMQSNRSLTYILAEGFTVDWEELLAEHRRSPFPERRVRELSALDDCPGLSSDSRARQSRSEQGAEQRLLQGQPAAKALARATLSDAQEGTPWGAQAIREGLLTADELVTHGKPARAALAAGFLGASGGAVPGGAPARDKVPGAPGAGAGAGPGEMAALVRTHLGDRAEAWVMVLRMLPDFPGTVPELLRTAALVTA